jgi:hypothetical protein
MITQHQAISSRAAYKKLLAIKLATLEPWAEFFGPQLKGNARLPEVRAAAWPERTYTFHVCVIIPERNCKKGGIHIFATQRAPLSQPIYGRVILPAVRIYVHR